MTWQLSTFKTVTGTCSPASVKTRVIPTFWAMAPEPMSVSSEASSCGSKPDGSEFDFHIHARSEVELHQRVDRLRGGIDDVEHALVRAHLELLARLLVDVRRPQHREALEAGRQRDGPTDLRAGPLRRRHDFARRGVEDAVIERFEANADILTVHGVSRWRTRARPARLSRPRPGVCYSVMLATTPAPTVRPPSRMAKRSFSSMAIGTISCTSIVTLSPGITISVPSGSVTTPVTSVVRK